MHAAANPSASPLKAIAWMIGSLLSFTAMAVSVRELTGQMHAFEMLFIRSSLGVLILLPILSRRGRNGLGWRQIRADYLLGQAAHDRRRRFLGTDDRYPALAPDQHVDGGDALVVSVAVGTGRQQILTSDTGTAPAAAQAADAARVG